MDHFVGLEKLPSDLEFPQELRERIRYEKDRKGLIYRDAMSRRTFEELWHLHTDADYRTAIVELFRIAVYESGEKQDSTKKLRILMRLGLIAAALVGIVALCIFFG